MSAFRINRPKTLAERLSWMAENLPGFKEELDAVNAIETAARQKSAPLDAPQRSIQGGTDISRGSAN